MASEEEKGEREREEFSVSVPTLKNRDNPEQGKKNREGDRETEREGREGKRREERER